MTSRPQPQPGEPTIRLVPLAGLLVLIAALVSTTPLRDLFRPELVEGVRRWAAEFGVWGPVTFVLGQAIAVALGCPGFVWAAAAGGTFGCPLGLTLALAGGLAGCLLAAGVARATGRPVTGPRPDVGFVVHTVVFVLLGGSVEGGTVLRIVSGVLLLGLLAWESRVLLQNLQRGLTVTVVVLAVAALVMARRPETPRIIGAGDSKPFQVPAAPPDAPMLRFMALGDAGSGDYRQRWVADAMEARAARAGLDLVLLLGDNFYVDDPDHVPPPDEQAALWRDRFEGMYSGASLAVPFYAVLGNNDVWPGPEAQIEYSAHSARWRMPGLYFKFTQAISPDCEVDFFGLDTRALHGGWDGWREQLEWLERELARSTARWKVVFGHNPIDSSGRHGGSRTLQRELLPILLAHGVDLYLCGHDHDMALMKPVDGLELVVSGSGGKSPRSAMWNDNVRFAYAGLGFTAVSLSETSMVIEFVDQDDETVYAYAVAHQEP